MGKRIMILVALTAFVGVVVGAGLVVAQDKVAAPTELTEIKSSGFAEHKKNSVWFSHAKHADYDCARCHHVGRDKPWDGVSQPQDCGECHKAPDPPADKMTSPKKLEEFVSAGDPNLEEAFHANCVLCHIEEKVKKGKTCNFCHQKEKPEE